MGLVGSARAGVQNYVRMMGSIGKAFRTLNLNIGAFRNLNLKTGGEADFSSFWSLPWRDDCRNEVQVGKWGKDSTDWKGGRALCDSPLRPWLGRSCLDSCGMHLRKQT